METQAAAATGLWSAEVSRRLSSVCRSPLSKQELSVGCLLVQATLVVLNIWWYQDHLGSLLKCRFLVSNPDLKIRILGEGSGHLYFQQSHQGCQKKMVLGARLWETSFLVISNLKRLLFESYKRNKLDVNLCLNFHHVLR